MEKSMENNNEDISLAQTLADVISARSATDNTDLTVGYNHDIFNYAHVKNKVLSAMYSMNFQPKEVMARVHSSIKEFSDSKEPVDRVYFAHTTQTATATTHFFTNYSKEIDAIKDAEELKKYNNTLDIIPHLRVRGEVQGNCQFLSYELHVPKTYNTERQKLGVQVYGDAYNQNLPNGALVKHYKESARFTNASYVRRKQGTGDFEIRNYNHSEWNSPTQRDSFHNYISTEENKHQLER